MCEKMERLWRGVWSLSTQPLEVRARVFSEIGKIFDLAVYRKAITPYLRLMKNMPPPIEGGLLVVSGRGMNLVWAQVWTVLTLCGREKKLKPYVLTTRGQKHLNRYFRLLSIRPVYLEDLGGTRIPEFPPSFVNQMNSAKNPDDFRALVLNDIPLGEIALSTYFRHRLSGLVDTHRDDVRCEIRRWISVVWEAACVSDQIFRDLDIKVAFFSEVFLEEYGGIYYAALNAKIRVLRFTGTVRDDAFVIQARSWATDRLHQGSIAPSTWQEIRASEDIDQVKVELMRNFDQRYFGLWHRAKRNHPDAHLVEPKLARRLLGIPDGRKVVVVFSHILYDTLFFFGKDLFDNYALWLIETVREAVANEGVEWFIKVHPSNLWRGEIDPDLSLRYEEEFLIWEHIGALPPHVHLVHADSEFSPLTWMRLADFGVTVRGTAGLEMAALGRTVVTAGTGRYEGNGFTLDSESIAAYREKLRALPDVAEISYDQVELAQRYAHGVFILKSFTIFSLEPRLRQGAKVVISSDDLIYVPKHPMGQDLPADLREISGFLLDTSRVDLLSPERSAQSSSNDLT